MKIWHPRMSAQESCDVAYWERNMLALFYADGWYYDDISKLKERLVAAEKVIETFRPIQRWDCGDNGCNFAKGMGGMRTNGGCHCLNNRSNGSVLGRAILELEAYDKVVRDE